MIPLPISHDIKNAGAILHRHSYNNRLKSYFLCGG